MNEFDEVCLEYFLAHQEQLLPEPVRFPHGPAVQWAPRAHQQPLPPELPASHPFPEWC